MKESNKMKKERMNEKERKKNHKHKQFQDIKIRTDVEKRYTGVPITNL